MANENNPATPSNDAMSAEEISRVTQQNQERNRPRQGENAQQGAREVINDNSNPRYGLTDKNDTTNELPKREYENQTDRMDDLER